MTDLLTDAAGRAARTHAAHLDTELRAAWRAGYDYVHEYEPLPTGPPDQEQFTITTVVLPSHTRKRPTPDGYRYVQTYVLKDVTRDQLEAIDD